MHSTSGRLTERSQSPNNSRKKLRRHRLVALAVSTLFFGYISARFPRFWVLATAGVLNRLSARLLGPLAVFAVLLGGRCARTFGTRVTANSDSARAGLVVAIRGEDAGLYAAS